MTAQTVVLVGIGVAVVLAIAAAVVIVVRRPAGEEWKTGVEKAARRADKPVPVEMVEDEPAPETVETEPVPAMVVATERRLAEVSPEEAGITRRTFFNRALGATFGTFVGVMALDMLAFLWPKVSGGFGADVNVGSVSALLDEATNSDGTITPVFRPEARAYIVPSPAVLSEQFAGKNVDADGVMALYQRCVHLGCRVPWCQPSQGFECPCHGSKYNGAGEYFDGPAPRNLDRFAVEVNGAGELIIKTGSILQTPRAPEKSVKYPQGPSCIAAVAAEH